MLRFEKRSRFPVSAQRLFAFHEAPDAFERLQPPWQKSEVIQPPTSLEVGTRVILRVKVGPLWQTIEAEHIEYEPGHMFADRMVKGPFAHWVHRHIIKPLGDNESELLDDVQYALPLGKLGEFFGRPIARQQLQRLFNFRHQATLEAVTSVI